MKNSTDITILLDKSGSMDHRRAATIENFNKFLKEQQEIEGECKLSLIQFSSQMWGHDGGWYRTVIDALPISEIRPLDNAGYYCNGGTALFDAIGKAIDEAGARFRKMPEADRPNRVIFVIITDGEENSSRSFSKQTIKEMIAHQEGKYSWVFSFLGAGIDAFAEAGSVGISTFTTATIANNNFAYGNTYAVLSNKLAATRAAGAGVATASTMSFNAQDLQAMSVTNQQEAIDKLQAALTTTDQANNSKA
jgi:hypothetical protein